MNGKGEEPAVAVAAPPPMSYALSEQSSVDDAASTTTSNAEYSSGSSSISTTSTTTSTTSSASASSSSNIDEGSPRLLASAARPRAPAPPKLALGMDPKSLVGKVLKHIRRSDAHPAVTLAFADDSAVQVLVDGYNPRSARVVVATPREEEEDVFGPASATNNHTWRRDIHSIFDESKDYDDELDERVQLEMDDTLSRLLSAPGAILSVGAAIRDCALVRLTDRGLSRSGMRFDAHHQAFAVKFEGEGDGTRQRWHCIWATRAIRNSAGRCVARTFDDVYVQPLVRQSPSTPRSPVKSSSSSPVKGRGGKRHQRRESWRN